MSDNEQVLINIICKIICKEAGIESKREEIKELIIGEDGTPAHLLERSDVDRLTLAEIEIAIFYQLDIDVDLFEGLNKPFKEITG